MKDDRELESGATCAPHGPQEQVHRDNAQRKERGWEGEKKFRPIGPSTLWPIIRSQSWPEAG